MNWEQKFEACKAIGEASIKMRTLGNWYVSHASVERVEGGRLSGGVMHELTPQLAIEKHWEWLTSEEFPVLRIANGKRVRWNGFMWKDEASR